jgi:hypothetical protein
VFFFFAGIGVLAVLFSILFVPETRHVPIEEVEEVVVHKHWFWSRVVKNTAPPTELRSGSSNLVQMSRNLDGAPVLSFVDPAKAIPAVKA